MTDIKLDIQSGKMGSKTKVVKKDTLTGRKELKKFIEAFDKDTPKKGEAVKPVSTGWQTDKIDYAERLFKIKQLEYKKRALQKQVDDVKFDKGINKYREPRHPLGVGIAEIKAQISKLLEDE